ncbi:hypothetical protein [Nitrobacter sp.]|uniref:hypothetical protein n=1 Tax=Nitrobacter sp. TaxID=29420 RepID=UPI0029CABBE7|nr:hypothetical protein [Nitrobacter sp.]
MKVDGPGTIGLHPLGPEQRGGRTATAFLLRDAKPALAGGGKKLAMDVAGSRSRRCFFSVAGLRSDLINRVRGGRGFGQQRDREIASWLQSIRAFSNRIAEDFAGSRAGKPLALNVILRVGGGPCRPCDRARLKTAPPFAPVFAVMNRRVRCGVGEAGPCDKGNGGLSLGKLDDPSFSAPVGSMRA